jgi:hypothetical protein
MKTKKQISNWCKSALMLPVLAIVLTFVSCQKDDMLPDATPDANALLQASPLGARAMTAGTYTITFEDARVVDYLAGPTAYGDNLYEDYEGYDRYYGYDDAPTGLYMMLNETGVWNYVYDFRNGGIAISQWNDTIKGADPKQWYRNQCSVYYKAPGNGNGGHNGSETFAVHFGYNDTTPDGIGDARSYITFFDPEQTCTFEGFYVTNSTYAVLSMAYGDTIATRPLDLEHQDWFKLVVEGIAPDDSVTDTVEFYLADFRTQNSPGIVTDWTYVDLSSLGEVTALRLGVEGSYHNQYGLVTPAYFCFDDLTVVLP